MELFDIPESKSPRMKWMERHCIKVNHIDGKYHVNHGMKLISTADQEDEALITAAKIIGIRLWNEENAEVSHPTKED